MKSASSASAFRYGSRAIGVFSIPAFVVGSGTRPAFHLPVRSGIASPFLVAQRRFDTPKNDELLRAIHAI